MKRTQIMRSGRYFSRGGAGSLVTILERQLAETVAACRLARAVAEGKMDPTEAHERWPRSSIAATRCGQS